MGMASEITIQQELIAQGEAQGFITYDDILARIPSAEQDVEALEALMDQLGQANIVILPEAPAAVPDVEAEPESELVEDLEAPSDEDLAEIEPAEIDLINDAGYQQAIDTDDVVGLYLKEAGRVPLLTAEEE